ncbi:MAG TPA: cell envelope integrity protein TolA [Gammaproteobacteria bacterium]|nr:cell envelope integrity protein TolA [Gammaproteobacteria bacterium]
MRSADSSRLRRNAVPFALALLLHVIVGVLVFVGVRGGAINPQAPPGPGNEPQPIKAVVVNESDYQAAQQEIAQTQQARTEEVERLKKEAEDARQSREKTEQQLADLRQQKQSAATAAAEQQQQLQQVSEQAKQAAAAKEAQQKKLQELQAQTAAAKKAQEEEAARLQKIQDQREAAEKAAAEAKAKAAAQAEAQRKAQLQAQIQAEENQRNAAALGLWTAAIKAKVNSNWNRPPSTPPGLDCFVKITQLPDGEVVSAVVQQCNGDAAVRQSVQTAILKSSPLPIPDDPSVFQRTITFEFNPGP